MTLISDNPGPLRALIAVAIVAIASPVGAQEYPLEGLNYSALCQVLGSAATTGESSTATQNRAVFCESTGVWPVGQQTVETRASGLFWGLGTTGVASGNVSGGSLLASGAERREAVVFQIAATPVPITSIPLILVAEAPFLFSGGVGGVATGELKTSLSRFTLAGGPAGGLQEETIVFDSTLPPPSSQITVRFEYQLDPTLELEVKIGVSAFCDLFAPADVNARCRASITPGPLQFDQETFDTRLGAQTFDLESFFRILPAFDPDDDSDADIEWVVIDDPGNAPDPVTGLGAVTTPFRVSAAEITNEQYRAFLQSVAATDPNGLYHPAMAGADGGILRFGNDGSYSYAVTAGRSGHPVNYVSFWDAVRYANWLHNGQPIGFAGPGTTEGGAYTLSPAAIAANTVVRNPGALVFLPNDDEWLKAAHYDPASASWFAYPAGSSAPIVCDLPGLEDEEANCGSVAGGLLQGASYTFSASPFGTYDQGGNAREWTERAGSGVRRVRGGDFSSPPAGLASTSFADSTPAAADGSTGFRVASPTTGTIATLPLGGGVAPMLGLLLLGGGWRALRGGVAPRHARPVRLR